jgi:hypothetical protein
MMPHGPAATDLPRLGDMATGACAAPASGTHQEFSVVPRCPEGDCALSGSHTPDLTRRRHVDFARISGQACPGHTAR